MRFRCFVVIVCAYVTYAGFSQEVLDRPIVSTPTILTLPQIIDSLSFNEHLDFSYDASLLSGLPKSYQLDSTYILSKWLNTIFTSDSTEWIFIENQIIVRLRKHSRPTAVSYQFKGKVVNQESGEPIPFATIAISGSSYGTVANINGEFGFSLKSDSSNCVLNFSSLGFGAVNKIFSSSDTDIEVRLKESFVELPEAVVVKIDPQDVLYKVLDAREQNYSQTTTLLSGFFRESVYSNGRYLEVVEAAISMSKPTYSNHYSSEKVMVEKVRRYKVDAGSGNINLRMQGGPFYFSKLDVARYRDFLPSKEIGGNIYSYYFDGYATNFDRTTYVISFKPINDNVDLVYTGQFYIDKESFAITRVEFQLTDKSIKRSKSFFVQSENRNSKTVPVLAKYEVNYRPSETGWILSYAKGELLLNVTHKGIWRSQQYRATSELAITESSVSTYQIMRNGYMKARDILSDKAAESSPMFWKDYVVIPPLQEVKILFEEE